LRTESYCFFVTVCVGITPVVDETKLTTVADRLPLVSA
jgi:hypothetical protein